MDPSAQFDDTAQVQVPSTPQPHHATLPADSDLPPPASASPTTSMKVANPSSPPVSFEIDSLPAPVFKNIERSKYTSPPPPSSSMTPPPSSQHLKRQSTSSTFDRDTTPTPAIFSSPPPTVPCGVPREAGMGRTLAVPTSQHTASASPSELREMLQTALNENSRLDAEVHEARMSAAHYKLQHNLLLIETEEATKRMEVEHEMTRREIDVLQAADLAREASSHSPAETIANNNLYIAELKTYCEAMDSENAVLHRRLERAKKIIGEKEEDINDLLSENRRYVDRIRENREHMRVLKSPGGMYASAATPRNQTHTFPTTPQYARGTPKQHTPHSVRQTHHQRDHDGQDSFATLLLADRVLNDQNSAPSTPLSSSLHPQRNHGHLKHSRNVHSLSSLPTTPIRGSQPSASSHHHLLPSVQFVPQSEPRYRSSHEFFTAQHVTSAQSLRTPLPHARSEKRRKSRDSTISAEDAEELAAYSMPQPQAHSQELRHSDDDTEELESDGVHESRASAAAAAMLRRDPREGFEGAESGERGGLVQARIVGAVTKGEQPLKRKRLPDHADSRSTKMRGPAGDGVGLGIYGA